MLLIVVADAGDDLIHFIVGSHYNRDRLPGPASVLAHRPGREGEVGDPEVLDHAPLLAQARGAAPGRIGADHAHVLGPGDEERADVLTIYDDNEHYETFSVNPAGQAGVYI